ncbi:MAG: IclR family transcriptional regulator [Dehalococcoidia bacterium]
MSDTHLRSLNLLEYMLANPEVQSPSALASALGVARATIYRMLDDLIRAGWLLPGDRSRPYRPSLRLAALGLGVLRDDYRREVMFRNAAQLAGRGSGPVLISFLEGAEVVYTDTIEVFGESVTSALNGTRMPAACSAPGKAMLATLPEAVLAPIVAQGCPPLTSRTRTTPYQIRQEIELTRERGYGFADGEYHEDFAGVAMAVFDRSGSAVGAMSIGRTRPVGFEGYPQNVLEDLRFYTEKASAELGYLGSRGAGLA